MKKTITMLLALLLGMCLLTGCGGKADPLESESTAEPSAQTLTVEQAMDLLYEGYVDAELFHPGELDKWEGDALLYCFVYDDSGQYRYAYVNSATGAVEIVDEIVNYTGMDEEGYISVLDDDGLVAYLLANVEEAYERVYEMRGPLEAKVPGDNTDLPEEAGCRDILLESAFGETIIRYTVAPSGAIYEYFPDDGEWGLIYVPGAVG